MRTTTKLVTVLVALFVLVTTLRSVGGDAGSDEDETTAAEPQA